MNVLDLPRPQPKPVERCWTIVLPRPRDAERPLRAETMNAAEQMFFFGAPLAHVVEYEENLKETRREQAARRLGRARGPHNFARQLAPLGALSPALAAEELALQ